MTTSFETILSPLDRSTFLQEYYLRRPHQWHTDNALWARLREVFAPEHLESLLPGMDRLRVWCLDRSGFPQSVTCSPNDAWRLYLCGHTLYGMPNPKKIPELREVFELGRDLSRELELSDGDFALGMFASCRGAHTHRHYDYADGITMQLHGIKRWSVGPPTVKLPLEDQYEAANPGTDLYAVSRGPKKSFEPKDMHEVTMRPGSMLYMPRGGWHETWTDEDSTSLDFNFSFSTFWKDYLAELVRNLMAPVEEARLPFSRGPSFPGRLEGLLEQLRSRLDLVQSTHLGPDRGPRPAEALLCWNPLATYFVRSEEESSARVTFHLFSYREESEDIEFTIRRPWLPVFDALRAGATFTQEQLVATPLPARQVASVLDLLWKEGILIAAPPARSAR